MLTKNERGPVKYKLKMKIILIRNGKNKSQLSLFFSGFGLETVEHFCGPPKKVLSA